MCFEKFVKSKKDNIPLIAEKDIICYKIVFKKFLGLYYKSLYRRFVYHHYKLYKCTFDVYPALNSNYMKVEAGFHSYKDRDIAIYNLDVYENRGIIVKFIIPKGSKYYENAREYVSNQIRVA